MPKFKYVATNERGAQVKATVDARSEAALREELLRRNLSVQTVSARRTVNVQFGSQKVPRVEVMHFSRQLAAFIRSGIPLIRGLEMIADASKNGRFVSALHDARDSLREGLSFTDALGPHATIFPPYYLGILRSAELTGRLDVALEQLSVYMERDLEARSKIKSALTYPIVVMMMSVVTVVILTTWVLPRFTVFFKHLNSQLPLPTRMLLAVSGITQRYWFVWLALLALVIALLVWGQKTPRGRSARDRLLLGVPLVKDIVRFAAIERFCRILGAMVSAGISLPEAIGSATVGANNYAFAERLQHAHEKMLEGDGIANPLAATGLFPDAAIQMVAVGEQTGTLELQLQNAASFYSRELEYRLKKLTALFEPAVIIVMAVIVGFVALALVSAMYGVFQGSELQPPPPGL